MTREELEKIAEKLNERFKEGNEGYQLVGRHVEALMKEANEAIGGYGVEALESEDYWHSYFWHNAFGLYVNMGDTYDDTIVFDVEEQEFIATNWGDFILEFQERRRIEGEEE
jgi:hypothetical protein